MLRKGVVGRESLKGLSANDSDEIVAERERRRVIRRQSLATIASSRSQSPVMTPARTNPTDQVDATRSLASKNSNASETSAVNSHSRYLSTAIANGVCLVLVLARSKVMLLLNR